MKKAVELAKVLEKVEEKRVKAEKEMFSELKTVNGYDVVSDEDIKELKQLVNEYNKFKLKEYTLSIVLLCVRELDNSGKEYNILDYQNAIVKYALTNRFAQGYKVIVPSENSDETEIVLESKPLSLILHGLSSVDKWIFAPNWDVYFSAVNYLLVKQYAANPTQLKDLSPDTKKLVKELEDKFTTSNKGLKKQLEIIFAQILPAGIDLKPRSEDVKHVINGIITTKGDSQDVETAKKDRAFAKLIWGTICKAYDKAAYTLEYNEKSKALNYKAK